MGAFLEKPKTEKTTAQGEGAGIRYGVSAMQGWRMEMEDAHICNTDFKLKDCGFFGVFDGHAGSKVSQYCSTHLLDCILEKYDNSKELSDDSKEISSDRVKNGILRGFLQLDDNLRQLPQWASGEDRSGTTAVVVTILPDKIIWANCGDSRGILCRSEKLEFATVDHKPYKAEEKNRIEKAGGTVMMQRVNGSLAVSRALGDFDYKRATDLPATEQLVSPEPEITVQNRDPSGDEFLLLACDGVFDVMSNDEVIAYIRHHLKLTNDLSKICSDLIDTCLNKNSRDNMSAILVTFPNAPKVSQEAIEQEEKLREEAREAIEGHLKLIVEAAQDPLEVEENYVMRQLTTDLPIKYDLYGQRSYIVDRLTTLKKEKFGSAADTDNMEFSGSSDPADAPSELQFSVDGNEIVITGIMAEDMDDGSAPILPVTEEGKITLLPEKKDEQQQQQQEEKMEDQAQQDTSSPADTTSEGQKPITT